MMHRCSSSSQGPCSCGLFHHTQSNCNSFSMLFSKPYYEYDYHHEQNSLYVSPSVDCTLSLGTPSTRLINENEKRVHDERRSSNCMPNFCWDILQPSSRKISHGRGNNSNTVTNSGGDPLSARRCANCDTTSTPLWRNGPRGPKSLCNACGIRFKKEERRATAVAAATNGGGGAPPVVDTTHMISSTPSWMPVPCISSAYGNEFRFVEDDRHNRDVDHTTIPFLSWRCNVTDRPSLVHDFTR